MKLDARVGKITAAEGSVNPLTTNTEGALYTVSSGGKYTDLVLAEKVFTATTTAAVALTAQLTLAFTGLVVENPLTSGKNYIMLGASWGQTVATPTATLLGLMTGVDAGDAASAITIRNRLIGSVVTSDAVADMACTLVGTPVREMFFGMNWTEATSAGSQQPVTSVDLDGGIILEPGGYIATCSEAANTAAFWFSFLWAEEDI